MGHIAFGAPGIASYHLHERLQRLLQQRGHTVTVLCTDAVAHTFWRRQGEPAVDLLRGPSASDRTALAGLGTHCPRTAAWLARLQPQIELWFDAACPDLLLLHQRRSPDQALLQFVARTRGCRVLWCGDGLLPHTLQFDERGLDGDANASRRSAIEFRAVLGDAALLQACLANALADSTPCALPRRELHAPAHWRRGADLLSMWRDHGLLAAGRSLRAWTAALAPVDSSAATTFRLPQCPFVAVLLQDHDDARVRLDAGEPPTARELVEAAYAAVRALDHGLELVIIDAASGRGRQRVGNAHDGLVVPARAAATAAAVAVATITINHPLAATALLAGTPVLHTGAALYGLRGVTVRTTLPELADSLRLAVAHDHPSLRQRFLSWLFGYGHVWCSGTHPDYNGLLGFVQAIEARLRHDHGQPPRLHYRAGPAWPLSAPARRQ